MIIKIASCLTGLLLLLGCMQNSPTKLQTPSVDKLAESYVQLGLTIGLYDPDFVDAYYGPDSLKPAAVAGKSFPKDSLLTAVSNLTKDIKSLDSSSRNDTLKARLHWMSAQLAAFAERIRIFSGETSSFDSECRQLYAAVAPVYDATHFKSLIEELEKLLPGKGSVPDRFQQLANHFIIPVDKLDTVFKTAIAESRRRTKAHYDLPTEENFSLEYVNNKPWSGYNWYKGHYRSVIQINTDTKIFIDRAIDVGSHESYPGHHVYNMMLEKNLYNGKGYLEISLYPLFSPQSLIAEGSANYGIEVAFPGKEKTDFARQVLLPLAGLDTNGISTYFRALAVKEQLNYARNEAARGLLNGTMTEEEALRWLMDYSLMNRETALKSISFIRKNRGYVINYNYGKDLVRQYVEKREKASPGRPDRWKIFEEVLNRELLPDDLLGNQR